MNNGENLEIELKEMVPGLNSEEMNLIIDLVLIVSRFHFAIFPETKGTKIFNFMAEKIENLKGDPLEQIAKRDLIAYDSKNDDYVIFPHRALEKVRLFQGGTAFLKIWEDPVVQQCAEIYHKKGEGLANLKIPFNWGGIPTCDRDEILFGLAAHEVRHRVQQYLQIQLITQEDIKKLQDFPSIVLGSLIDDLTHEKSFEKKQKTKAFDIATIRKREFDAQIIHHLAIRAGSKGKSFEDMIRIIKVRHLADLLKLIAER